MELFWILLFSVFHRYVQTQGVYAPANAQIVHSGQTCVVKEDNISERIYTIREGDTLVLQCLVKGHPRPQVNTNTHSLVDERHAYGSKSGFFFFVYIRMKPVLTVHQTVGDVRGNYYQEKTVFLRCTVNSNPPARFIWKRGNKPIEQSKDNGVDIYEPLYTQGETKVLKLKNLRPQDFANYTCQVSVRNVCDIPDSSVTFRLTNTTTPPALKLSVNETYVVDPGQDVTLSCEVTAGFPTPRVTWSRYPGSLPQRSVIQGGSLTLRSVTPTDAGVYNCTAVNNVGNPARRTANLIVRTMKNLTFQITPDSNKDSESIQMGRDLKLSCHVDAQPQDKVNYTWYKNGALIYPTDSLIVLRSDPDMPPATSSLEIVDMKFRDQATYSCVANFPGSSVPELRVDVNITQSSVVPPVLSVPVGGGVVNVSEGGTAELVCLVDGKPRPPVLWSRANKDLPMPSGDWVVETRDGRLRLTNVTRDMMGAYRCQTAPYNGLNIKRRQGQVQLNIFSPQIFCIILKSMPDCIKWLVNNIAFMLCFGLFVRLAQPYNAEFYYDTPNPIRTLKNNYSYILQWTQKEPGAVDKTIGYWINVQQNRQTVLSKQITTKEPVKGVLMSYTLTDLRIPLSYEVSLTPITSYGTGNTVTRTIQYSEPYCYNDHVCGFEDIRICGFTQDRRDVFDWTRQNHLTQNPKRSVNTGPDTDRSGTKEGYYMYIETSRPRQDGDRARLLSPLYNVTAARGPTGTTRTPYCVSFYYHMNGKHMGTLNVLTRVKSIATVDSAVWSLSGHQGPEWRKADAEIYPSGPFQVVFEGIRGNGFEGDIAIDDVSVTKGKCKQKDSVDKTGLYHQ
uniref:MAM domain containing glycosylphosphatidylinositol anchor 1 n=1 Tax=Sinocyclocheilus rhinocerous TaxID=307959 RepID=A0A673JLW2_9TELE